MERHILRARNQELARHEVVSSQGHNEAFIVADWAMKFLPRKFREGQIDWFGKRALNWHITFVTIKKDNDLKHLTHVHIFDEPVPQDSATTAAILCDVVHGIPSVDKVNFWSDNAVVAKAHQS